MEGRGNIALAVAPEPPHFSDLLGALGVERLRAHITGGRPLHVPAPDGLNVTALLSAAEFEGALLDGAIPPERFNVYSAYTKTSPARLGQMRSAGKLREWLDKLAEHPTTFVATALDRSLPRLWQLAYQAEQALGERVVIGAVRSNAPQTGIEPHYDRESVIVVQIEGEKTWRFFGAPVAASCAPKSADTVIPEVVSAEITMRPGDLMFVPSGLHHVCTPHGRSLHLGILIVHQAGGALLQALRDLAGPDDPALYAPLSRFLGAEAVEARAEAYRARLIEILTEADPVALLAGRLARRLRSEAFTPDAR